LDMAMPDFDGLQLQTALSEKGCILPIIFLTGHGDVSKSVQAMKQGAFDFLSKPVKDKDLLTAVRAAIERDTVVSRDTAHAHIARAGSARACRLRQVEQTNCRRHGHH